MPPKKISEPTPEEEMQTMTPREQQLADEAEKNKNVKPQLCDVTSTAPHALRVIYNFYGTALAIQPGQTRKGIPLHPKAIEDFKNPKLNLQVVPSAA